MHQDDLLQRLGLTSAAICAAMAAVAFALAGLGGAAAVVGGGLLVGISMYALGSGTQALATLMSHGTAPDDKRRAGRAAVTKLVLRYALLGFLAYVMIARLRLPPLGLIAGASSVAAAVFVEAVRFLLNGSKRST